MVLAIELALHHMTCAIPSCAVQQRLATAAIDKVAAEALITQLLRRLLLLGRLLLQVNITSARRDANATHTSRSRRYQCRVVWRIVRARRLAIAHFLWETAKEKKLVSISVTFREDLWEFIAMDSGGIVTMIYGNKLHTSIKSLIRGHVCFVPRLKERCLHHSKTCLGGNCLQLN